MSRKTVTGALGVVGLTIGVAALETVVGRRLSRRLARGVARVARYQSGRLAGLRYRLSGRHPDPSVSDKVLGDRVRSMLGGLEHRLDVPRVHVQVEDHEVLLHGNVSSDEQVEAIVNAARDVPGVLGVTSHLHVGLLPGDSRPSEGVEHPAPSAALDADPGRGSQWRSIRGF